MTEPRTEAGRRLLAALDAQREAVPSQHGVYANQAFAQQDVLAYAYAFIVKPYIAAIEAEAIAAYVADLRAKVEGLPTTYRWGSYFGPDDQYVVLGSVLRLLDPEESQP